MTDSKIPDSAVTNSARRRILPPISQVVLATLTGLALRLLFVLRFPLDAGDTPIYEELARNWIDSHVYGLVFANGLQPSDIRGPGYPAFIALIYYFLRRSRVVILLAQATVDLCTCFLVAGLAARLAPEAVRRRAMLVALWLAATCPFVANYAAVPLTEVLATFLTAAALVALVSGCLKIDGERGTSDGNQSEWVILGRAPSGWVWFAGGLLVGLATLVRPESPLLLAALALVLMVRWRHRTDWDKLVRAGLFCALGLVLPLAPWAARNWVRFHEVQFLAPRYATTPGEYAPRGLYAWTGTWLYRFRDVYLVPWNVDGDPVEITDIPPSAFDSVEEHARVAKLLDTYNDTLTMTPEVDDGFAELARERTARHPLRTYLFVPLGRAAVMWFTPRVELLPLSGHLTPVRETWQEDHVDFSVSAAFMALNFFYVALAIEGLIRVMTNRAWRTPLWTALALLAMFLLLRTAFLTTVETPEPRYVLECFPAVLALGALALLPRTKNAPRAAQDES